MAEVFRKTKLALVEQDAQGTLKAPSGNSDFVSAQDDLAFEGAFEGLENAELTGSTMAAAPVQGFEGVTGSLSHYLRHSGTEGVAPQALNVAIKAAFGKEEVAGAELTLAAGSTTTVLKYADTSSLSEGEALLIKDNTNGWNIRNIASVDSGTDVTLNFALPYAPASGVATGKAVRYEQADSDSDYANISVWQYAGDGGAIAAFADCKCNAMTANFPAGGFINSNYSFEGLKNYWNPLIIDSTNKYLDITDDGGTFVVTLSENQYTSPHALASEIQTKGAAAALASGGDDFLCSYSDSTGKFTISTTTGTLLSILWKTGTHGADNADDHVGTLTGFSDAADDTGAISYIGDSALSFSTSYAASGVDPLIAKNNEIFLGAGSQSSCTDSVSNVDFSLTNTLGNINALCASTGREGKFVDIVESSVTLDILVSRYDADLFQRWANDTTTSFAYNFGSKDDSGNWEDGKSGSLYIKNAKLTTHTLGNRDGLVNLLVTVRAFSLSGAKSVYLNFV